MNILLFSDIPPSTNYSSGIVLNKLCGFLLDEGHQVNCFTCMNPELKPIIPEDKLKRMKFTNMDKPNENWGDLNLSRKMNKKNAEKVLPQITKAAAEFAKKTHTELIWVVEQGQSIILQARPLAEATQLPYIIQTWDSPQWWMKANRYDEVTQREVLEEYGCALRDAECFIAASWIMEKEFKEKYNCKKSKAVVLGFKEDTSIQEYKKNNKDFVIAIAGQIYAVEEFKALLEGLSILNWEYHGKHIYLDIYAPYLPGIDFESDKLKNVRIKGWKRQSDLLVELQNADLLYCPYWFDPEYEIVSHTSFPSKLSTYLSIKRPVVVHGPSYASPLVFMDENDAGYRWHKIDGQYIAEQICRIIDDENIQERIEKGTKAFRNYLTEECMRRDFFEALDIPIRDEKYRKSENAPLRVIHVNNVDLLGNRFNGYDMLKYCEGWNNIEIKQLVLDKLSKDKNVMPILRSGAARRIMELSTEYEKNNSMRALIQPFGRMIRNTRAYLQADIVHYHLIHNGIMSFLDLPEMTKEKASVLTVHDPWIVTGHCIHPMECEKWKTGCEKCENLDLRFAIQEDRTHMMWRIRKKLFEDIDLDLIVASKWMEYIVKSSPITSQVKRIHRIPFGIDLNLFKISNDILSVREKYKINPKNFVVMFRQDSSAFKGMPYIIEALKQIPEKKRITVLTVGATGLICELKNHVGQIVEHEWVTDPQKVAEMYSCCDVFLMPSMAEAFGLMAIEAMASSKPIIVFQGTALPEVVHAPDVGISVPSKDSDALAKAIIQLMENPEEARRRGELGRALCEREYQFKHYVDRHIELYKEIVSRKTAEQKKE